MDAKRLRVDDPATGEVACEVELLDARGIDTVVGAATRAARELASTPLAERIALCERFCTAFAARAEQIASDVVRQMGKPIAEARREVTTTLDRARYMMSIAAEALAPIELPEKPGFERRIEKVPVGVVLDIAAWNYPLLIPVNVVVPAVLAGNAVVLKHSSRTPLCGAHFADAFSAAGAPRGAVTAVNADHAVTAQLVARPEIGYVSFTGSVGGGEEVSRAAAGRFIDVGLELGGKDPAYVRADADVAYAAEQCADGALYNTGQSCCAVERIYVDRRIHAAFLEALVAEARKRLPGNPKNDATQLGAMAQARGLETVARQVEQARAQGARVVNGGAAAKVDGRGRYYEATVVDAATHAMEVMTEETFGPVAPVMAVSGDDEAVRLMNDSRYGLTASIWTRDVERGRELAGRVEAGTVFLNRCDYLDPALPWSGWKDSGHGVSLSRLGFDRLVRTRAHHYRLPG
jgi:acyl-CoA reductase-like NAD-dependent aldehyde dehydrogenase